jgi:hypothetical protein
MIWTVPTKMKHSQLKHILDQEKRNQCPPRPFIASCPVYDVDSSDQNETFSAKAYSRPGKEK